MDEIPCLKQINSNSEKDKDELSIISESDNNKFFDFGHNTNQLHFKEKSIHCQALVATCILVLGVVVALVMDVEESKGKALAVVVVAYIVYLIVGCITNRMRRYLE